MDRLAQRLAKVAKLAQSVLGSSGNSTSQTSGGEGETLPTGDKVVSRTFVGGDSTSTVTTYMQPASASASDALWQRVKNIEESGGDEAGAKSAAEESAGGEEK